MLLTNMFNYFTGLVSKKDGQGMVEYILIIALIALAVVAVIAAFGPVLALKYQDAVTKIQAI